MSKKKDPQGLRVGEWHRSENLLFKLKDADGFQRDKDGYLVPRKINDVSMLVQVQPYDEARAEKEAEDLHLMLQTHGTASLTEPAVREKLAAFLKAGIPQADEQVLRNLLQRFVMKVE